MTHRQFIESNFDVLAKTENAIFFSAHGELCCEINGQSVDCHTVDEFFELVDFFGNETFEV